MESRPPDLVPARFSLFFPTAEGSDGNKREYFGIHAYESLGSVV